MVVCQLLLTPHLWQGAVKHHFQRGFAKRYVGTRYQQSMHLGSLACVSRAMRILPPTLTTYNSSFLSYRYFKTFRSENNSGRASVNKTYPNQQLLPSTSFFSAVRQFFSPDVPKVGGLVKEVQNVSLMKMLRQHREDPMLQDALLKSYLCSLKAHKEEAVKDDFYEGIYFFVKQCLIIGVLFSVLTGISNAVTRPGHQVVKSGETEAKGVQVTFNDVKGCDEATQELRDVVQFLREPERFAALGAKLPKGVLLVGPPGVGKTLLARAVAGEANVSYLYMNGSQFDDTYVGIGAARLRNLFQSARKSAPCVIFIDEFDAVGRKRSSSPSHPHANQTVNQLLAEMDGFSSTEGIIVLASTNRMSHLDPAVLRPGRFDLQIHVSRPNLEGRVALLQLYLGKVRLRLSSDWDTSHSEEEELLREQVTQRLAHSTIGFTGADIQNVVNQAAIIAGVHRKDYVSEEDLWSALDRMRMGSVRPRVPDMDVCTRTAYHEAGHALACLYIPESKPLHKVTILPRDESLGHTSFLPNKEDYGMTKAQLKAALAVSLGGRVAEELIFGAEVDSGAFGDFQNVTRVAESMVKHYGMSEEIGPRIIQDESVLGATTKELIDAEVRKLVQDAYERVRNMLTKHRRELDLLAEALLKYETLDLNDVKAVIREEMPPVALRPAPKPRPKNRNQRPPSQLLNRILPNLKSDK